MPHHHIQVAGRVQGVGFRAATQAQAQALGLRGYVQNQPDGSVFIEAVGPHDRLEQLAAWCHQGPAPAQVSQVQVRVQPEEGDFEDFVQRR
jgi:acylphosphatase